MKENKHFAQSISVIISTYNRYVNLSTVLQSLIEQETNETFTYEIVIVDNNSNDKTKETIESFIKKDPRVRYVFEPKQGKCNALNTGISNSKGEIIVFTDDDVILDKSWILNIVDFANKYDFDAFGGRVLPMYFPDTPEWVKECKDILSGPIVGHDYGETIKEYDDTMFPFIGANMAIKRKVFAELGGFNPDIGPGKGTMGDDTELFIRIQKAGKKIYYNPLVVVMHPVEKDRAKISYIARWSFMAGKYMATQESMAKDKELISYWGVPRYLFPRTLKNAFSLMLSIGSRRNFVKNLRNLSINAGMISGYYQLHHSNINDKKSS